MAMDAQPHGTDHEARFRNRQAQVALATFSGLIAFIGLAGITQRGSRLSGVVFLVLGVASLIRALRSSDVIVDDEAVYARSILRTRRFPLADLDRVQVEVGRTGMNGFGREYLRLYLKEDRDFSFRELNSKPSLPDEHASVVQQAAAAINARLRPES
jgi:hypothetical protein